MKLSVKLLTLFAASSVFAYSIPLNKKNDLYVPLHKRYDDEFSDECIAAFDNMGSEFEECTELFFSPVDDINQACRITNSEKCKKVFNFKFSEIPKCKSTDKPKLIQMEKAYKFFGNLLNMQCLTDENNKLCPLLNFNLMDEPRDAWTKEDFNDHKEKAINDTCKSKKCSENLLNYAEQSLEILSEIKSYMIDTKKYESFNKILTKIVEILKSDNCKSQTGTAPANNNQAGTTQAGSTQTGNLTQTGTTQTGNAQAGSAQTANTQTGNAQASNAQPGNAQAGNAQAGNAQAGANQTTNTQPGTTQDGNGLATNNSTVNNQTATNNSTNTQTSAAVSGYKLSYTLVTALVLVTLNLIL